MKGVAFVLLVLLGTCVPASESVHVVVIGKIVCKYTPPFLPRPTTIVSLQLGPESDSSEPDDSSDNVTQKFPGAFALGGEYSDFNDPECDCAPEVPRIEIKSYCGKKVIGLDDTLKPVYKGNVGGEHLSLAVYDLGEIRL